MTAAPAPPPARLRRALHRLRAAGWLLLTVGPVLLLQVDLGAWRGPVLGVAVAASVLGVAAREHQLRAPVRAGRHRAVA